ncbi:MAG: nicotinate phosphoribosyltransferase [Candidatus Parcubacteria bacterium]|nr:nicotinate phosphoribosyltransferase [Candidatus Parcubacteria bacterium]
MKPTNSLVNPMLTDLYQLTMAYAYWKSGRHNDPAVFDLFFRKCPFKGEFAICAGLEEVLKFVQNFKFSDEDIAYLKTIMPGCDPEFFIWLDLIDCSEVKLYAVPEGTAVFPREPLIRVEGPLAICQLLETTLLNLVNFASLMTTNAARFRLAAGDKATLLEFGLRRAQGPDGAISAAKYAVMGGFNGTSNVLAGKLFNIPVKGTHAHAFVQSFTGLDDLTSPNINTWDGKVVNFVELVMKYRRELGWDNTNAGELIAFIAYAQAFPQGFLALVDTYNTLNSGVKNFLLVALALHECGYKALGIRLDSGDLAYLSQKSRELFKFVANKYQIAYFINLVIAASNDITVPGLLSMNQQGHEINTFGIGTHAVTCQEQPAFGGVYKLVAIKNQPRIKRSEDASKITLPGRKNAYRLYIGEERVQAYIDLLTMADEPAPKVNEPIMCQHPFEETKRVVVTPRKVKALHQLMWAGQLTKEGQYELIRSLLDKRDIVKDELKNLRPDHLCTANPSPYKVAVSGKLYGFLQELLRQTTIVFEVK